MSRKYIEPIWLKNAKEEMAEMWIRNPKEYRKYLQSASKKHTKARRSMYNLAHHIWE